MVTERRIGATKDFVVTERDRKRIEKEDTESSAVFKNALREHRQKTQKRRKTNKKLLWIGLFIAFIAITINLLISFFF